ncbi:MAG: hypothetical protein Q4D04_15215 [Clostridia bacterium]|nr:hypothetical protein [Clostridia bacterium]
MRNAFRIQTKLILQNLALVCFRNLQEETNKAIALFGDREAGSVVMLKGYDAYYNGYDLIPLKTGAASQ